MIFPGPGLGLGLNGTTVGSRVKPYVSWGLGLGLIVVLPEGPEVRPKPEAYYPPKTPATGTVRVVFPDRVRPGVPVAVHGSLPGKIPTMLPVEARSSLPRKVQAILPGQRICLSLPEDAVSGLPESAGCGLPEKKKDELPS